MSSPQVKVGSAPRPGGPGRVFKIIICGDVDTGKTSLIKRWAYNVFNDNLKSTIGVDFGMKMIKYDDGDQIRLQIWDIAGQERFGAMTRSFYAGAVAAFVVYDISRLPTLAGAKKWKSDIDAKVSFPKPNSDDNEDEEPEKIPVILLANKIDLANTCAPGTLQTHADLDNFCKENGFVGWLETSAKDNINLDEAGLKLVAAFLPKFEANPVKQEPVHDVVDLNKQQQGSICC